MAANARLATLAWRNIWRNRRRTLITVFGMIFGVFLAVLMTGIGDSTYGQMINYAAKMGGGHVVVQHEDYQRLPSLKKTVKDTAGLRKAAGEVEGVVTTVERITGAAMLATAKNSQGAGFIAIDPEQETPETFAVLDADIEGEFLTSADQKKAVVLGRILAENLGAELGSKVVFTVTGADGEIVSSLVRVVGIIDSGAPSIDASLCLLPIDRVRKSLGYAEDEATAVAVFVDDHRRSQDTAAALAGTVGEQAVALDWSEAQPELAGFIAMKEGGAVIFEGIIMVLLAAGIFNTLFVSVMERLREFGIMAAVGFTPRQLFSLVMWESLWLALVGLVGSVLATAGPYYHLSTTGLDYAAMVGEGAEVNGVAMDPTLYVSLYPESAVTIAVIVIFATMVSGLYPAWKAGRANPADAIRLV